MRIHCLREMGYEGTTIYVMHFGNVFQYLFSWKNKVYQNHVVVKPVWWRRLPWVEKYGLAELEGAEHALLSGAMDSIDSLKKLKKKRKKSEKKDKGKCMWRVRQGEEGEPMYECMYHEVMVPMEDGKVPNHEK